MFENVSFQNEFDQILVTCGTSTYGNDYIKFLKQIQLAYKYFK